jgi:hypothetical protein
LIAELMALDSLYAEMRQSDALDQQIADEPEPVDVSPDASRVERRIAQLQNVATSERHFRELLRNEGLPEDVPFLGNPERARARRRIRERGAERHAMNDETPGALARAVSRIKSFAETVEYIARGVIYESIRRSR